jgi:hypothetical protein
MGRPDHHELMVGSAAAVFPRSAVGPCAVTAHRSPLRYGTGRPRQRPRFPIRSAATCAKIEVALCDELSLSLRPRPAEFAAADRPHAKGPGPAVPTALDPVGGMRVRLDWVMRGSSQKTVRDIAFATLSR